MSKKQSTILNKQEHVQLNILKDLF